MLRNSLLAVTIAIFATAAAAGAEAQKPIRIVLIGDSTVASYTPPPKDKPDLTGGGQVFGESVRTEVPDLVPHLKRPVRAAVERPGMYFADTVSGRPISKDPAVVKFQGRYLLYYSLPDYPNKPTKGWSIGIAASVNLRDWKKIGELKNSGEIERNGFCSPGALVIGDRIHLFYQTYGNARHDAICHAWSKDGIAYTRDPTNPVFRPTGSWNCGRAIDADVIVHEGRLLLYWATRDPAFKVQMQGVASAPLGSDFARDKWTQLSLEGPILKPELPWEGRCIEAAAMARHGDRIYMFYGGNYNNAPQQIGVAVSRDGIHFTRLSDRPFLPNGASGTWNSSESGHPFFFHDDDGKDYLFYQGNNDGGRTWYLSMEPIEWKGDKPVLARDLGRR